MKKSERQEIILEIINHNRIETQEDLVEHLKEKDVFVTQATISRDIKELKISKLATQTGKYLYAGTSGQDGNVSEVLMNVFSEGCMSVVYSANIVVVNTHIGMAPACALAIDAMHWPGIVGTLAGDDTILVITKSASESRKLTTKFLDLIKSQH